MTISLPDGRQVTVVSKSYHGPNNRLELLQLRTVKDKRLMICMRRHILRADGGTEEIDAAIEAAPTD